MKDMANNDNSSDPRQYKLILKNQTAKKTAASKGANSSYAKGYKAGAAAGKAKLAAHMKTMKKGK